MDDGVKSDKLYFFFFAFVFSFLSLFFLSFVQTAMILANIDGKFFFFFVFIFICFGSLKGSRVQRLIL